MEFKVGALIAKKFRLSSGYLLPPIRHSEISRIERESVKIKETPARQPAMIEIITADAEVYRKALGE